MKEASVLIESEILDCAACVSWIASQLDLRMEGWIVCIVRWGYVLG